MPGGDLVDKPACDSVKFRDYKEAARERRVDCDGEFMKDITRNNPNNPKCDLFSGFYPFVVRALGSKNFLGMDSVSQVNLSEGDKTRYIEALNLLFATWTNDQIATYAKAIEEGKAKVNLDKPIKFDRKVGLKNVKPKP
jgi:hypothetical protein